MLKCSFLRIKIRIIIRIIKIRLLGIIYLEVVSIQNPTSLCITILDTSLTGSFLFSLFFFHVPGFPGSTVVKNLPAIAGHTRYLASIPGQEDALSRKWQPTPIFFPGKFHGQRSLVGYSPCGLKESDLSEHTHTHILFSWTVGEKEIPYCITKQYQVFCLIGEWDPLNRIEHCPTERIDFFVVWLFPLWSAEDRSEWLSWN